MADLDGCIDLLVRTNRLAEAVLFAQTYKPSRCREIVGLWKAALEKNGKGKVSRMLGVPPGEEGDGDADLFPEWDEWLRLERDGKSTLVDVGEDVEGGGSEEVEAEA